ncbi:hypothetical protein MN608_00648 [Microdochium nivale]|nr:hypothetical protein MN608_00648 [Microdochium nivale]
MCLREVYGDPCSKCGAFVRNGGLGKTWCSKALKAGRECKHPQTTGEAGISTGDHAGDDKDGVDNNGDQDGTRTGGGGGGGGAGGVKTAKPKVLCDDCRGGRDDAQQIQVEDWDEEEGEDQDAADGEDYELPAYPGDAVAAANADVQNRDQPGDVNGQDVDCEEEYATIPDNDSDGDDDDDDDELGPWNRPWAADPYTGGADYDMDDTAPLLARAETEYGQPEHNHAATLGHNADHGNLTQDQITPTPTAQAVTEEQQYQQQQQNPDDLATAEHVPVLDGGEDGDDNASGNEVYYTPCEVPPSSPARDLDLDLDREIDDIDDGAEEDDDTAAELARRISEEMERARVRELHEEAAAAAAAAATARRNFAFAMQRVAQWCRDVEEQTAPTGNYAK